MTGIRAFTFKPHDGVPPGVAPFVHATAAGQTLYVTDQMPTGVDGVVVGSDVATQTSQVVHNLSRVTELCGGGLTDVVSVRAYLITGMTTTPSTSPTPRGFPTGCRRGRAPE